MHAHYCDSCRGYSPCAGGFPASGFCLLVDRCVRCEGVPSDAAWRIHPDNAGEFARAHAEFHGLPTFMRPAAADIAAPDAVFAAAGVIGWPQVQA